MIARIVIHLDVGGCRWSCRKAHGRNDRRKPAIPIGKSKSRNIQKRSKDVSLSRNNRAAEGRVEKILLRHPPGKNLAIREKPVGDRILDFIGVGKQVDVVDHDSSPKSISAVNVSIVDAGLDHVTPTAKVPLQLRADEIGSVVERSSIHRVAQNEL